ncbi:putative SNF2 family helicase/ATPase [Aspergillus brunneoviolaceus CBS 621.78]|uniref:Uncharacterized protein n=1 Tax=Aspergillus brunneoviolaceus CBS 621.78 TaxID=1450534 RepID=A0ACD1G679_9EURO|nr:hypothetical protein BO95DRAFT_169605 [Aspergillus brunneoviolaceus CBS 621.78]RAH44738.1 hypothetical protein BO95DRAFT_169605 [Aspergillus brunneoviolaceus CBS 621.78]
MEPGGDPLDWTVDEVVQFLCHNPDAPWSLSSSVVARPDPVTFEAALRDNVITGEVLLHDVDIHSLKDDLGLKALGPRSSMHSAVRYLQRKSSKYLQSTTLSTTPFRNHVPDYTRSPTRSAFASPATLSHTQVSCIETLQRDVLQTPRVPPSFTPITSVPVVKSVEPQDQLQHFTAEDRHTPDDDGEEDGEEDGVSLVVQSNVGASSQESHKRSRPGEQLVIDREGRKRRKLDLSKLEDKADSAIDKTVDKSANQSSSRQWYMGPDATTPSKLFYPSSPATEDDRFLIFGSQCPPARRTFVNKCLSHFYRQDPVRLGPTKQAVIPYNPIKGGKAGQRFFTLYTSKGGHVAVSKQDFRDWPQLENSRSLNGPEPPKTSDPYSWLLEKYPAQEDDQDAFPLYGDSGSEGDYDEETWREIDEESRAPVNGKRAKLTSDAVESIIEKCIVKYETEWQQIYKPKEAAKAWAKWMAATRSNSRNQQIKELTRSLKKLEGRLHKLKNAIKQVDYSSEPELQTQCQALQQTIFRMQKHKYHIHVIGLETCPPKVAPPSKLSKSINRHSKRSDDAESLDSDSDDFIDDSEVPPPPVQRISYPNGATQPSSSSDDEGDIISVSGTIRRVRSRGYPFAVSSSPDSTPVVINDETPKVIDLTDDTPHPDDYDIATPPLNPVQVEVPRVDPTLYESMSPVSDFGSSFALKREGSQRRRSISLPDMDDYEALKKLDSNLLEERRDPRRLLIKLIANLAPKDRFQMAERIPSRYEEADLRELTVRALELMLQSQDRLPDFEYTESMLVMRASSFYISWVTCSRLTAKGIARNKVRRALREVEGYGEFYQELSYHLKAYCDWERGNGFGHSDVTDTPHRLRKREVKESEAARKARENAQRRVAMQENSAKLYMESMGAANTDHTNQVVSFGDPPIHLHQAIARRVKPHQLKGIQFMWRELIVDETHQGCLLAHTMGLGKTMQVISLLVTISAASNSLNPDIKKQVPERFRRSQTLVLCPSSLTDNWQDELYLWTPPTVKIGPFYKITSSELLHARLETVQEWYEGGGILILSYDMFRSWIMNRETSKRSKPLPDADHEKVKRWLLDGPNIVIADEAHKMKNSSSAVAVAAMQIKTKSRVALTGSPLANNLTDYYAMVNWIAEGYLGEPREFQAHYVEPIEEGLYVDSTYTERRRSLVRLNVLKEILEPKINRADISVLAGSLPPKVEFVITVPLTDVQQAAYNSYVRSILEGRCDVNRMEILSWLAVLGLCCNHPVCFRDKLQSRFNDAQKIDKRLEGFEKAPGDEPISQLGLDLTKLQNEQEQIYSAVPNIEAIELSHRARILHKIINESVRVGDKVLVFSHSIPTLNYVEVILSRSGWRYCRLDGQTPVSQRQGAVKRFNGNSPELIYLISTRAGGLGLNIPGANRVIIFDFTFNPVWEEQAVGRAYRLGQKKPVFVYRFLSGGTFEEVMYNKAVYKTQLAFRVVDKKNPVRWASKKLGEYLFPVKNVPQTDVSEYIGKDPEVLDKILERDARSKESIIRKIGLTETFQKEDNDKLTEEEKREALEVITDERLKREDPAAWQERMREKQRLATVIVPYGSYSQPLAQPSSMPIARAPLPYQYTYSQHPPPMPQLLPSQSMVPPSAHNSGPPALGPDLSHFQLPGPMYNHLQPPPAQHSPLASQPYSQPVTSHSATMQDGLIVGNGDAGYAPPFANQITAVPVQATGTQNDGGYSQPLIDPSITHPVQTDTIESEEEYFPPSPVLLTPTPASELQQTSTESTLLLDDKLTVGQQQVVSPFFQNTSTPQQETSPSVPEKNTVCKTQ